MGLLYIFVSQLILKFLQFLHLFYKLSKYIQACIKFTFCTTLKGIHKLGLENFAYVHNYV